MARSSPDFAAQPQRGPLRARQMLARHGGESHVGSNRPAPAGGRGVGRKVEPGGRILIAHPDPAVLAQIAYAVARAGYNVSAGGTGDDLLEVSRRATPDLIVLSAFLPPTSGFAVLEALREHITTQVVPVIVVDKTAPESASVRAFALGADDYVAVEPFQDRALVHRIAAILRRVRAPARPSTEVLDLGIARLDVTARRLMIRGRDVDLSEVEVGLLLRLAAEAAACGLGSPQPVPPAAPPPPAQHRIDKVTVHRLRAKLGAARDFVETVRGAGYRLLRSAPTSD